MSRLLTVTSPRRARATLVVVSIVVSALAVAIGGPTAADPRGTPVMGRAVVSAQDLAGWFRSTGKTSRATVDIDTLARYFIEEGEAEGVAGDIAFAQSIVETGYFSFSDRVRPEFNNFSGLGAVDSGTSAEVFPDARTGVRAQIQHLRAYADPGVTVDDLAHPLVDTRFHLVRPTGRAPTWEQFGGGVWATDPDYAGKVLRIRLSILQWGRRYGTARFAPFATAEPFVRQGFRDVLFREASGGEIRLWDTALRDGAVTPEQFVAELFRGEGASTVQQVTRLYFSALGRLPDRAGLAYWTNRRKAGAPLSTLAAQVIGSREFTVRFGTPDDGAYVDLLYQNVLGRLPDGPGRAYWQAALASGRWTRTSVLLYFSESSENRARTAPRVEVAVLHLGLLLAPPDLEITDDWRTRRSGGQQLEDLVFSLLTDASYLGRF
jgi:hypothetical protein